MDGLQVTSIDFVTAKAPPLSCTTHQKTECVVASLLSLGSPRASDAPDDSSDILLKLLSSSI